MTSQALEVSPRPSLDAAEAARLAAELFGVTGEVSELGSHQDRNFRIRTDAGPRVLKVANRSWGRAAIEAQNGALLHVAARDAGFRAPVPLAGRDGQHLYEVGVGDEVVPVRLLTFVEGAPLSGVRYLAPGVLADLGRLAALSSRALADFDHPGLDRVTQWDLQRAEDVVASLLTSISDPDRRQLVAEAAATASTRIRALEGQLRRQAIHSDVTDDNVVGPRDEAGRVRPDAVIDFGDLVRGWLVSDLAVTCAALSRVSPHDPFAVLPVVEAFHAVVPLQEAEVAALWPMMVMRGAVLVASGEHQAMLDPDNDSATGPLEAEARIFHTVRSVPYALAESTLRSALGFAPTTGVTRARSTVASGGRLFPSLADVAVVDLSTTSQALHSGRFLATTAEHDVLADAAAPTGAATTRWGEARLTRTRLDSREAPATVALGVDLAVPSGTEVVAPWDVTVAAVDGSGLTVDADGVRLTLRGVADAPAVGATVARGSRLARVGGTAVHVQLCSDAALDPPDLATPVTAPGWTALCPDPSPLLGVDVAAPDDDAEELLHRRTASFARVQEHYYAAPMRIERGWRHHLLDTRGRAYVDMVNNVAAVGHGHPALADAVDRQMRMLNTNSRFHYAAIAELSERLASLSADGLDTVFLVNSGSEAVDLALHMAQVVTGRMDVVAVREAYHGWTLLSDAVTTSLYDNPTALETRPDWVHLASAPNPFRGRFRGPDSGSAYATELRELVDRIAAEGRPPAAFICEPVFGNAGGVLLPEGYLPAAYEAVRAVGGLTIADEVQVGYGRLGHTFWAYDLHGVTPDMITVAKAMGNGHPLGAVITTRAIADAFSAQGNFFSSAGGSPVSCVVGLTVLDLIEQEGLQANAAAVGDRIVARATELMKRHPIVGAVHGMGLYLGIELVRDRETLEPATAECAAVCERLRELGVIVQPTGERANVLKIKPPMCLTAQSADFVLDQLETVLREGW